MTLLVLVARLVLVGVFVVSGVAKLRDREGSRTAVRAFGVPASLVPVVTVALPVVELLAATLLLGADPAASAGAALVLAMLLAFTAAIVANLVRGRTPECHCFGQASSAPVGWTSVVRNGALALIAVLVLLPGSARPWVGAVVAGYSGDQVVLGALVAALTAAVVALGLLLRELTTRYGRVLLRVEQLEAAFTDDGTPRPAPEFTLPDLDGRDTSLAEAMSDGAPAVVVFISPGCVHCGELLPDLARWQSEPGTIRVLAVSEGSVADNHAKTAETPGLRVLLQEGREVIEAYGVQGTPGAVLVAADGTLSGEPMYGVDAIRQNVDAVIASLAEAPHAHGHAHGPDLLQIEPRPVREGDPVPVGQLRSADGDGPPPVQEDEEAVLVFWEATCGYCLEIAEELSPHGEHSPLVVVSATDAAVVRGHGITARIARDPAGVVGAALQVPGTPTAALVRAGAVVGTPAVGGPDVLALLDRTTAHAGR